MLRSRISPSLRSMLPRSTANVFYSAVFIVTVTSLAYMLAMQLGTVTEDTLVFLVQ